MKHSAVVTRLDAIVAVWLTSGLLSPLFTLVQIALSVYWTFFDSIWMETYSSPVALTIIGALGVLFYFALFQIALFLFAVVIVAVNPRLKRGFLGAHSFEIRSDGLFESTPFNETIHKWPAVDRISRVLRRTFVRIGGSNWHVIPDRDFADRESARAFLQELRRSADAQQRVRVT